MNFTLKKFFAHFICCFIPSKRTRGSVRSRFQMRENNNRIILVENGRERRIFRGKICGFRIMAGGHNNCIKIHLPMSGVVNCDITMSCSDSCVEIHPTTYCKNLSIDCSDGKNQFCSIGKNTGINGLKIIIQGESSCIIGENCMFADNIDIRTSDQHPVIDTISRNIINYPNDIKIGNKCWIGHNVIFTKNASLGDNVIVGKGSVVSKAFLSEKYIAIAGNPAKIIKHNVDWDHRF